MRRIVGRLAAAVVGLDQLTKAWMLRRLALGESVPVIPGLFHLTLVRNPGVAFGLFARQGGVVLGIAGLLIAFLLLTTRPIHWMGTPRPAAWRPPIPWAVGLILGGALGNLVDRVRFGAVVDFLDFRVWPVFNVADSCITVGAALVVWAWWRGR